MKFAIDFNGLAKETAGSRLMAVKRRVREPFELVVVPTTEGRKLMLCMVREAPLASGSDAIEEVEEVFPVNGKDIWVKPKGARLFTTYGDYMKEFFRLCRGEDRRKQKAKAKR